jgi:hypothetical protein
LTERFQRTPEQRRRPLWLWARPTGLPCGAGRPRWGPPVIHLHVMASNQPLWHILTIVSSRFDPRAMVHPTGVYKQRQTPTEAYLNTSIYYLQSSSGEGSLERITSLEPSNQEED